MKALSTLFGLGLGLVSALSAQSPLITSYAGGNGLAGANSTVYFDVTVNTTITLQGLELHLNNATIVTGTINLYMANTPFTTYVSHELVPGDWTLMASGPITSNGLFGIASPTCFTTPLVVQPGTYGCAVHYATVFPAYTNGNGSQTPGTGTNQTFSTAEVTLRGGAAQGALFAGTPFSPRVFNGGLNYYNGVLTTIPCSAAPAANDFYGAGCYRKVGSWYQYFGTAATASVGLSNKKVSMIFTGTGYIVQPGTATFVTPTGATTLLAGVDDGEVAITGSTLLTAPGLPTPSGTINSLTVDSNGIVATGPIDAAIAPSYWPFVPDLLTTAPVTAWYAWHDYNVADPQNTGTISWHEDTGLGKVYVTWNAVESYPTNIVNPSTVQFQFDTNSGQVDIVWGAVTAVGTGAAVGAGGESDLTAIGYSPGGPSLDHGQTNISTFTSLLIDGLGDAFPLTLGVVGRPVLGGTSKFTTSNQTPLQIGALFLSLADLPPFSPTGLDLGLIDAAGCVANIDPNVAPIVAVITDLFGPAGMTYPLFIPIDLSFIGNVWYGQSVWLDPAVNGFGMLTSNAVKQTVGTW